MAERLKSFFRTFFTKNIGWKLLSLALGFLLWSMLSNSQDPIVPKVVNVPVTYMNQDLLLENEDLVFMSGPETVAVTVSTRKSRQSEVTAALFTCTADLVDHVGGDISSQRVHIKVNQAKTSDAVLDWAYPKNDPNITVVLDNYISKSFEITLASEDSLIEGLILEGSVQLTPSSVLVSGPSSLFSNLSQVKALVNLKELSSQGSGQISYEVPLTLYDANDREITDTSQLTLSQDSVTLSANVLCLQTVRVVLNGVTGTPADGYRYVSSTITDGSTLTVAGLKSTVSDLTDIYIPADVINIDGISQSTTYTLDISSYLPDQVILISGGQVTVTVDVEELVSQTFTLSVSDVAMPGQNSNYNYSVRTSTLKVKVRGFKEDLDVLASQLSVLAPTANVEGYGPGSHMIPVTINQPSGYIFDNLEELQIYVVIEEKAEPTAPSSETTEESSAASETEASSSEEETVESQAESI